MLSASAPTPPPPPPPPPLRTDTRVVEPDDQWKADLRRRIEHELLHMVEDAQIVRDTILNSQPSESSRERAQRDYEESMNNIRTLAQDVFIRLLRQEMCERKCALDVVSSNTPYVARQQQWILDNIRKAKAEEELVPHPPSDAPQNAEGVLSASPQQQSDSEQGSEESSEEGYGTGGLEDEEGESEESEESVDEEVEEGGEVDHNPRQDSQAGQPYSPGATPRRQSSGSQASIWRPSPHAPEPSGLSRMFAHANGQAYNVGLVQFPRRGSVNITSLTSSNAGLHRTESINPDQYRSSSVAPHGSSEGPSKQSRVRFASNISTAPRERQTSASPHDRPSPPTFPPTAIPGARPSLDEDEAVRFPTSASPSTRAINAMQPSPGPAIHEEAQGMSWSALHSRRSLGDFNAHRRHNSKGESRLPPLDVDLSDASDDVVGQLDDRLSVRSVCSTMSIEQLTAWWETEARKKEKEANRKEREANRKEEETNRKEEGANRKEEEANRKEEEARCLEENARQSLEEARRLDASARQAEASAKHKEAEAEIREAAAQKREAEAQRKEADARHRQLEAMRKEEQAQRNEEDACKREDDARRRQEAARRFEEDAGKKEDEARRKEEAKHTEEEYERKKREIDRKEAELNKREAELLLKENAARLAQEATRHWQALESSNFDTNESSCDNEDASRLKGEEASRTDKISNGAAEEAESTAPEQEEQPNANGGNGFKAQARGQEVLEEQRRQKEVEEQEQRLEEQRLLEEERRRFEEQLHLEELRQGQIRLDEELSRQERERLDREALLEQERLVAEAQEREASRFRDEEWRAVEEEQVRILEEQLRKVNEKIRQRDVLRHQQQRQRQQDEILGQRAREEQQREFERREAQYAQRKLERERQNSMGASSESRATPHRTGSTTGYPGDHSSASSTFNSSAGSTWSSQPSSMSRSRATNTSFTSSSIPISTAPKPSLTTGVRSDGPGTSYHILTDEVEWARRAEERARQQQEQFKREQVRLESERQVKSSNLKRLTREELSRLYENHENKWRQLRDSDINNLDWNCFAWPVFKFPSEPDEMTAAGISAYVLSNYAPAAEKTPKDRIKDHLKRWHPDKFELRIFHRVVEEERDKVKTGAGVVVSALNEMLNRNYD